ncbi:MAG: hypothetical protein FJZ95_01785 [Chloroflexi bacterium]|nr:hypothetical protein [Chloroflexota bacterium]
MVVRQADKDRLLDALHGLGVLHIVPINPGQAVADERISQRLEVLRRTVQVLSSIAPAGEVPSLSPESAADEVLEIQRRQAEWDSRLSSLYRQLEQQSLWGNVTVADLSVLKDAGVELLVFRVPTELVGGIKGEVVKVLGDGGEEKTLVAVIDRGGKPEIPEEAELVPLPTRDNPSLRAEAAEIDLKRRGSALRLAELAHLLPKIDHIRAETEEKALFSIAARSALNDEHLFAIQGWVPVYRTQTLGSDLESRGVIAGIRVLDPGDDETPPTLVQYPRWALPIKSLFDMLGTLPGYREVDISLVFMITMPVFAAMLNGDAGYGMVFLLPALFLRHKVQLKLGREGTQLLIVFGIATVIWGMLNNNYFGVKLEALAGIAPLDRGTEEASRNVLIAISFLIASAHLVTAHVRRIVAIFPDTRILAQVGWIIVLLGMLGLIWAMFPFLDLPVPGSGLMITLAVGIALVMLFGSPHSNPLKRLGIGFASSLLPLISSFGDTMSYIRLVAVGLASYYIAVAFNDLGSMVADSATWVAAVPILLFGHTLNIILVVIAIFAHGVRLNMLEFSSHCNVEWSGQAYTPFAKIKTKES